MEEIEFKYDAKDIQLMVDRLSSVRGVEREQLIEAILDMQDKALEELEGINKAIVNQVAETQKGLKAISRSLDVALEEDAKTSAGAVGGMMMIDDEVERIVEET